MLARVRPRKQLSRSRRRYQPKTAKLQIDEDIRNAVEVGAATVDEVMEFLIREGLQEQRYELARQRAQRMLTDASARRTQAEADIKHYLPPLPRSAKRLFNHLRVLLVIAEQKHMFGGQPELQAIHVGKWAVLMERWPELGSALTADPGRLAQLETANSTEELLRRIGSSVPTSTVSQDLLTFLGSRRSWVRSQSDSSSSNRPHPLRATRSHLMDWSSGQLHQSFDVQHPSLRPA